MLADIPENDWLLAMACSRFDLPSCMRCFNLISLS